MASVSWSDLREARHLDRLPIRIKYEIDPPRPALRWTETLVLFAIAWVVPAALPLLAYARVHPIWLGILGFVFVIVPLWSWGSDRPKRSDALRPYGPPAASVMRARVLARLPRLLFFVACAAAIPVLMMLGRGAELSDLVCLIAVNYALVPFFCFVPARGASVAASWECFVGVAALAYVLATGVMLHRAGDAGLVGGRLDFVIAIAVMVAISIAILRRFTAELRYTSGDTLEYDEALPSNKREPAPVDFGVPVLHRPAASARASERLLEELQLVYQARSVPLNPWMRVFVRALSLGQGAFALAIGCACVVAIDNTEIVEVLRPAGGVPDGLIVHTPLPSISLMALWGPAVFFGASSELSATQWLLGRSWREQYRGQQLQWLLHMLLPFAIGAVVGVFIEGRTSASVCALTVALASLVLRHGWIEFVKHVTPQRAFGNEIAGTIAFVVGLPILHFCGVRMTSSWAFATAGIAALVGLTGVLLARVRNTEAVLGERARASLEEDLEIERVMSD